MIAFRARIARKQPGLPRFIVVPADLVADRTGSFDARVTLNGGRPFARRIHPWGKGQAVYFFNLTAPQCKGAGVDTGALCDVVIEPEPAAG